MTADAPNQMFAAPWGIDVKIMTFGGSAICLGFPFFFSSHTPHPLDPMSLGFLDVPLLLWFLCCLFTVRGYSIRGGELFVHRLIWSNRFSLDQLHGVDLNTAPFDRAIRLLGNPGIFGVSGHFYQRRLGLFKAFVTNKRAAIVLRFKRGAIVLSPGDQRRFLEAIFAATY